MDWTMYIWIPVAVLIIAVIVGSLYVHSLRDRRMVHDEMRSKRHLDPLHRRARRNAEDIARERERRAPVA